jgi:RimJ/RimL family protein N-acetyltransferase
MSLQQQFDFNKEYILENDRVLLRPLCIADLALLQNYVETEPEIWTYSLVAIRDVKDVGAYIETAIKARKEQNSYTFIVYDKMLKTYVGCTRFYDIQLSFETTQLGYTWYSKKVWGTGINTHCKFLLLQFAFENIGFKREVLPQCKKLVAPSKVF